MFPITACTVIFYSSSVEFFTKWSDDGVIFYSISGRSLMQFSGPVRSHNSFLIYFSFKFEEIKMVLRDKQEGWIYQIPWQPWRVQFSLSCFTGAMATRVGVIRKHFQHIIGVMTFTFFVLIILTYLFHLIKAHNHIKLWKHIWIWRKFRLSLFVYCMY